MFDIANPVHVGRFIDETQAMVVAYQAFRTTLDRYRDLITANNVTQALQSGNFPPGFNTTRADVNDAVYAIQVMGDAVNTSTDEGFPAAINKVALNIGVLTGNG